MTAYRYDALGRIAYEDRVVLGRTYTTSNVHDNAGNDHREVRAARFRNV